MLAWSAYLVTAILKWDFDRVSMFITLVVMMMFVSFSELQAYKQVILSKKCYETTYLLQKGWTMFGLLEKKSVLLVEKNRIFYTCDAQEKMQIVLNNDDYLQLQEGHKVKLDSEDQQSLVLFYSSSLSQQVLDNPKHAFRTIVLELLPKRIKTESNKNRVKVGFNLLLVTSLISVFGLWLTTFITLGKNMTILTEDIVSNHKLLTLVLIILIIGFYHVTKDKHFRGLQNFIMVTCLVLLPLEIIRQVQFSNAVDLVLNDFRLFAVLGTSGACFYVLFQRMLLKRMPQTDGV